MKFCCGPYPLGKSGLLKSDFPDGVFGDSKLNIFIGIFYKVSTSFIQKVSMYIFKVQP